jgi:sulfite exporter TauE/SafE
MRSLDWLSLLMLGLLGTGHCLGMCGPLVFALTARSGRFRSHLCYHLGRITTYMLIGGLMGLLGSGVGALANLIGSDPLDWIAAAQIGFSFLAAAFLFLFGLSRLGVLSEPRWMALAEPARIPGFHKLTAAVRKGTGPGSFFLLGLMLGLLPCGLSFAAFARAMPSGSAVEGAALLLVFGVGTLPGLLLLGTGAARIAVRYRRQSEILSGLLMLLMALSMLARSLTGILA